MMIRTRVPAIFRTTQARYFSVTPLVHKNGVDAVKDAAEKVNRGVGDAAVAGINKTAAAAESIKDTVVGKSKEAAGDAKETLGEAKGKAAELKGEAKGKAEELKGEAKSKM